MTPLNAIVRNGKIEILAPNGCNEGDKVTVWIGPNIETDQDDDNSSPDNIQKQLKAMTEFEPMRLTAGEQEIFEHSIKEQRRFDVEKFAERTTKLESTFK